MVVHLCVDLCGEEARARNLVFPCKVAAGGEEGYPVCVCVGVAVVPSVIGSSSVFCNEWLFIYVRVVLCHALVESLVADRSVMAAWLLPCSVAMCVERCGLAT